MTIHGFQKLTLLDFPGKTACTVFTGGCNLRCPFCHNALLVTELEQTPVYEEEEILRFLEKRRGLLDGVAFTGGEPLMNADLPAMMERVKAMGFAVKLDTNGTFPQRLREILDDGLADYVAMDVKNALPRYAQTVGVEGFDPHGVEQSMDYIMNGTVDYEFRTTVVREFHRVEDIREIAKRIAGAKRYFLQNFVDSGNLIGENLHAVDKAVLKEMQATAEPFVPTQIRGI